MTNYYLEFMHSLGNAIIHQAILKHRTLKVIYMIYTSCTFFFVFFNQELISLIKLQKFPEYKLH